MLPLAMKAYLERKSEGLLVSIPHGVQGPSLLEGSILQSNHARPISALGVGAGALPHSVPLAGPLAPCSEGQEHSTDTNLTLPC